MKEYIQLLLSYYYHRLVFKWKYRKLLHHLNYILPNNNYVFYFMTYSAETFRIRNRVEEHIFLINNEKEGVAVGYYFDYLHFDDPPAQLYNK